MDASHNPVVRKAAEAYDYVANDTDIAQAIMNMQRYDPEFKLEDLGEEVPEIF